MKLLKILALLGLAGVAYASPSAPPAGNYIANVSTFGAQTAIKITSATINSQLYLPFATANQCLQTDILKNVVSAACVSGGSGGSSIGVNQNAVNITSPTLAINALSPPFLVTSVSAGTTAQFALDSSSVTLLGNSFNGASQLVQTTFGGALPALSATNLTNIPSANLSGPVPAANLSNAILNQNTLQSGSTSFVSSATVRGQLSIAAGSIAIGPLSNINYGTNSPLYMMDIRGTAANTDPTPLANFQYSGAGTALQASSDNSLPAAVFFNNSSGDGMKASKVGGTGAVGEFVSDISTAIYIHSTTGPGALIQTSGGVPLQIQGTGDAQIQMTVGASTYTATYSSGSYSIGQFAVWSSTSGALIGSSGSGVGTPGGSNMQLQYNGAGTFGGAANSSVTSSSITYVGTVAISTLSILMNGAVVSANTAPGALDIYGQSLVAGTHLLTVGSSSQGNSFYVPSNQMVNAGSLGLVAGTLALGDTANSWANRIYAQGDTNNFIDVRTGSTMTFQTGTANGPGDMRFQPGGTLMETLSTRSGVTINSSATVQGASGMGVTYNVTAGSMTGAGLTTCGDTSHALGWSSTNNLFTCQNVTGSGGGGGASVLGVGTGTAAGYTGTITSTPTSVVLFDSATFTTKLTGGATAFVALAGNSIVMTTTGAIASSSLVTIASCTTRGASPNAWITLTLPAQSRVMEPHRIYNVGTDSCSIRVAGNGTDVIGSTGTISLDAQGTFANLEALGNGSWGGDYSSTPWSVFTTQDDVATFTVAVASQVTMCPVYIPSAAALTGFRMTRPVANGTNLAAVALFDRYNRFITQSSSITLLNSGNDYMTGGVTNLAKGWYKVAYTAVNTTVAIGGSNSVTDVKMFCGTAGTSTTGMDLSTFAPAGTLTTAGTTYPAIGLIFNGGLQGY